MGKGGGEGIVRGNGSYSTSTVWGRGGFWIWGNGKLRNCKALQTPACWGRPEVELIVGTWAYRCRELSDNAQPIMAPNFWSSERQPKHGEHSHDRLSACNGVSSTRS